MKIYLYFIRKVLCFITIFLTYNLNCLELVQDPKFNEIFNKSMDEYYDWMVEKYNLNYENSVFIIDKNNGAKPKLLVESFFFGPITLETAKEIIIKSTLDLVDFLNGKESLKKVFGSNFDVNCIEHSILILNQKNLLWHCEDLEKWEKGICYLKLKDKEILYHAQNEESSVQYCEDLVSILFSMNNIFKCCLNN